MAATAEVKLVYSFADDTARDLKIGPLDTDATLVSTVKTNVKAFDPEDVKNIYLSDAGATCTGITAATVVEVEETEINLNDAE